MMLLEVRNLTKIFSVEQVFFGTRPSLVKAVDDVSFTLEQFSTLGIVGESGSGKTTLSKILLGLVPASSGQVHFNDAFIKNFHKDVQIIFQNPFNSLDPKMRIKDALYEPLVIHSICPRQGLKDRAIEMLKAVGMDESALERYPAQFSGGQRQRICIARALACEPKLLVLDEPISSLDLTIQAKLLDLFLQLKQRFKLTYIFISHNLSVIKYISDTVLVMQNGRVVEQGSAVELFAHPAQTYTRKLLEAAR
jgi:peptide/nickel transport system ATP-binding protein